MQKEIIVPGTIYGFITLVSDVPSTKVRKVLGSCECGYVGSFSLEKLKSGHTKSCGCKKAFFCAEANVRHFHAHRGKITGTYRSWQEMKNRCLNKKYKRFHVWGGRGISLDPRWHSFDLFLADMGEKGKGLSLDRIDNEGNYTKGNCRWATPTEQARNSRRNINITIDGKTECLMFWVQKYNLHYGTVISRIRRGADPIEALKLFQASSKPSKTRSSIPTP